MDKEQFIKDFHQEIRNLSLGSIKKTAGSRNSVSTKTCLPGSALKHSKNRIPGKDISLISSWEMNISICPAYSGRMGKVLRKLIPGNGLRTLLQKRSIL